MSTPNVTVNIRNIAFGGDGVGEVVAQSQGEHLLGISTFVPFTAVGERVVARVEEEKKNYIRASLQSIEQTSPSRVMPECRYFSTCGGCELQHISYEAQVVCKQEMISGALRAGKLSSSVIARIFPLHQSSAYDYRRRITLHVDAVGNVGFYRSHSRSVVPIDSCVVAVAAINELLPPCRSFGREVAGRITSILLEADEEGVVVVLKSPYDLGKVESAEVLSKAKNYFSNVVLLVGEREIGGFGRQILKLPLNEASSLVLHVPAGAFSQVNWRVNQELIRQVVELSGGKSGMRIYDLFSGAGNFSLPLARTGASVVAVESEPRLVSFGKQNIGRYSFEKRVEFVDSSVQKFIAARRGVKVDTIVADPPRNGLGNIIGDLKSDRLLLISCHLPSFVRDLRMLIDAGWNLQSIRPFDMFPQTTYVEILADLTRS